MTYVSQLDHLYMIFVMRYHDWVNVTPPDQTYVPWHYRAEKWESYVKARDEYLNAVQAERLRLAQQEADREKQFRSPH